MSQPSRRILDLSPGKRALLESLLRESGIHAPESARIPPRPAAGVTPVSFGQQRLWFLDQLLPGNPLYNIPAAVRLTTAVSVPALRRSLQELVRRHEVLRTTFAVVEGQPVQVVAPAVDLDVAVVDLRGAPESTREAEAQRLAEADAGRPFALGTGPLLRATLLQLGDRDWILLLVLHHIVTDGWSMGVLFRELAALYGAFVQGRPSPLPELPIQYGDYAVWQRQYLTGEVRQRQVAYWREQLAALPVLALPTDRARPAVQRFQGAQHAVRLPAAVVAGLKAVSQRHGATLFMTLLAAFQTLLHRYTGQDDLVVGSPVAGRTRAELEGLIGFFVNTLVLRTDAAGDPPFVTLLARVQQMALAAYAHQDLPFEMLVEELHPERDLSRNPLFQTTFQLLNNPALIGAAPNDGITAVALRRDTAKFDLALDMFELPSGATGQIEYNTDLFEAATIERMAAHFVRLLEGIVIDPAARLSELPLLGERERRQLLIEWNDTTAEYPRDLCIHELFEAQVQRDPHAVAVVYEDQQVTYGELNARANQLAHYLRQQGVGPEVLVGVFLERSIEMVVAFLAVLKAGGAYVPLDVSYPKERLAFMIADTAAPIVLTSRNLVAALPASSAAVVVMERDDAAFSQADGSESPDVEVTTENLAYVMYTSGSTGRPKGACIPHRAVNRLVCNTNYIQLGPSDRVAQMSNASFDAATFEIWGALLNGARMIGISKTSSLSPVALRASFVQHGITALFITTPLFNELVNAAPDIFNGLRTVLTGGSAASLRAMRAVLEHGAPSRLVNVYGPTESTTFSTWYVVRDLSDDTGMVPIGRPVSNTQLFVLDAHLNPVPIGVVGELHIGGDGLARGYLNRPDLTAEKFVANPFPEVSGDRLYCTGDRVRYLPDGNIQFLGRLDDQVKIRGFRVELGEIESVLRQHPAVQQAVVIMREDATEDHRLIAYVVSDAAYPEGVRELRAYAAAHLPDYMAPSAFVWLDALPLSANGKLDQSRLPEPERIAATDELSPIQPRTDLERAIAAVWKDVLGLETVSATANFFDLGGHSLLLVRVHSRLRQLGHGLSMTDLFRYPTISTLAEHMTEGTHQANSLAHVRERARKQREAVARRQHASVRRT